MATVYLARHEPDGACRALKVLHVRSPALRDRLAREARVLGALDHVNVVGSEGLIELDGAPVLVMEWVRGPALGELLAEVSLGVEQVDALVRGILAGVAEAHARGLVHRDLKPSNVLLAVEAAALVPKVADFGLAKLLDDIDHTRTGAVLGTPQYMAPEQLADPRGVDARADVFALGALCYELLVGEGPFGEGGPHAILDRIRRGEWLSIDVLRPDLPERMRRAVAGALVAEREGRWADAAAMREAWCAGSEVATDLWPPALLERARELAEPVHTADETWTQLPEPAAVEAPRRWGWPLGLGLGLLAIGAVAWLAPDVPEAEPPAEVRFTRLSYNPLGEQILGLALSADGAQLLTAEQGGLFLRRELPGPREPVELPPGAAAAGGVAWCGEALAATLVDPEGGGVWRRDGQAWSRVLAGAQVLGCGWSGEVLLARTEAGLVAVDGEGMRLLAEGVVTAAALSPDAQQVVFLRTEGAHTALERVDVAGGEPERLREDVLPHAVAWDRRGRLHFFRERGESDDRWVDVIAQPLGDSLGEAQLVVERIGPAAEELAVSADGTRLAYLSFARQRDVFAAATEELAPWPLHAEPTPAFVAGWADADTVVFAAAPHGQLDLFARPLSGAPARPLLASPADEYGARRLAAGGWLVQRVRADRSAVDLVRVSEAGAETVLGALGPPDYLARPLTRCAGAHCFVASHAHDHLALSRLDGDELVPVTALAATTWRPVGWDVDPGAERIAWSSPDGLSLLALDAGETRVLPVDGQLQELVFDGEGGVWATAMDIGGHTYALLHIGLDSGEVAIVHDDIGWMSHLALSPDGAHLAWTRTTYDTVAWLAELGP